MHLVTEEVKMDIPIVIQSIILKKLTPKKALIDTLLKRLEAIYVHRYIH